MSMAFSRLVNLLKQWSEDRSVPEASTVQQMKALYAKPQPTQVFRNLYLVRGDQRSPQKEQAA